jgi:hypothetical protein
VSLNRLIVGHARKTAITLAFAPPVASDSYRASRGFVQRDSIFALT